MNRTTILLPSELQARAALYAHRQGISLGELIRRALEAIVSRHRDSGDMLLADKEVFRGASPPDLASRHDDHLYGSDD